MIKRETLISLPVAPYKGQNNTVHSRHLGNGKQADTKTKTVVLVPEIQLCGQTFQVQLLRQIQLQDS